jgi:hypothetical protein
MDEELKDVMREQGRRGRRPVDLQAQKEHRAKLASMRTLLKIATEEEFVKAMLAYGLIEGSEEFLASLASWREFRS